MPVISGTIALELLEQWYGSAGDDSDFRSQKDSTQASRTLDACSKLLKKHRAVGRTDSRILQKGDTSSAEGAASDDDSATKSDQSCFGRSYGSQRKLTQIGRAHV